MAVRPDLCVVAAAGVGVGEGHLPSWGLLTISAGLSGCRRLPAALVLSPLLRAWVDGATGSEMAVFRGDEGADISLPFVP